MPRGVKKEHLPSKVCVVCHRPFTWRKKWEKCWDEVTTCSKSCNAKRRQKQQQERQAQKQQSQHNQQEEPPQHHHLSIDAPLSDENGRQNQSIQKKGKNKKQKGRQQQDEVSTPGESPETSSIDDDGEDEDVAWQQLMEVVELTSISDNSNNEQDETKEKDEDAIVEGDEEELLSALAADNHQERIEATSDDEEQEEDVDFASLDPVAQKKALRKAEKKRKKAERRAQRQGRGDPSAGQKPCDMCGKSVDLLIRCQYDETLQWKMVCGKCWKMASGGVVDGDAAHPYYKYGGLWKNRRRK